MPKNPEDQVVEQVKEQDAAGGGTAVATAPAKPKPVSRPKRQPPYAVILENDDDHSMQYVIDALRKTFGYSAVKAVQLMLQAHFTGRAVVWTGSFEVAEFKRDRLRGMGPDVWAARPVNYPLSCTIEPLPE